MKKGRERNIGQEDEKRERETKARKNGTERNIARK